MTTTKQTIHAHAKSVLYANDRLILELTQYAAEMGIAPEKIKDREGNFVLAQLLNTSAMCLNALALTVR